MGLAKPECISISGTEGTVSRGCFPGNTKTSTLATVHLKEVLLMQSIFIKLRNIKKEKKK